MSVEFSTSGSASGCASSTERRWAWARATSVWAVVRCSEMLCSALSVRLFVSSTVKMFLASPYSCSRTSMAEISRLSVPIWLTRNSRAWSVVE